MARIRKSMITIHGDELMRKGVKNIEYHIMDTWRQILRGPFGEEMARDIKARVQDNNRSGYTASRVGVHDKGATVDVGIDSNDTSRHPKSRRANARSVGTWLESGTRAHLIPSKTSRFGRPLKIGNNIIKGQITHPGTKAMKPAYKTQRVFKYEGEEILLRELDRRLGPKTYARKVGGL